jgi:hypothetical protein
MLISSLFVAKMHKYGYETGRNFLLLQAAFYSFHISLLIEKAVAASYR